MGIKQPSEELPEQEGGVRLGDYVNMLVLFDGAKEATDESQYGKRDTVHANLWVFDPDSDGADNAGWNNVGNVIVWFSTVGKQIMSVLPDQLAGVLVKGTDRNVNEWAVTPVPAKATTMVAALGNWDPSF